MVDLIAKSTGPGHRPATHTSQSSRQQTVPFIRLSCLADSGFWSQRAAKHASLWTDDGCLRPVWQTYAKCAESVATSVIVEGSRTRKKRGSLKTLGFIGRMKRPRSGMMKNFQLLDFVPLFPEGRGREIWRVLRERVGMKKNSWRKCAKVKWAAK